LSAAYEREIIELHQFFEGWFNGVLPDTDAAYSRVETVLAPGMILITPDANLSQRDELLQNIRASHNTQAEFKLWVENIVLRSEENGLIVATYEEWQKRDNLPQTARLSTAIFKADAAAVNGLAWLHVHETWIIPPA